MNYLDYLAIAAIVCAICAALWMFVKDEPDTPPHFHDGDE